MGFLPAPLSESVSLRMVFVINEFSKHVTFTALASVNKTILVKYYSRKEKTSVGVEDFS